jgi:hypothetical protein
VAASQAPVRGTVPQSPSAPPAPVEAHLANALPPDIAYCLDAEVEFGGIGGDERAFVDLFDVGTAQWFDALSHSPDGGGVRFPDVVRERHAAWRMTAAPSDAMALDWAGLCTMRMILDDVAKGVMSESGTDATLTEEDVLALLPGSGEAARLARISAPLVTRCVEDVGRWGVDAFLSSSGQVEGLYRARSAELLRRDAAVRDAVRLRREAGRGPVNAAPGRAARRTRTLARRALARSRALLENLAGRERATAWLSGDEVTVEGRRFDFRLRVADPHRIGHGALEVSVTDKDGIELASLCVYVPDTPALDQVCALVLHVTSGEEDEILRRANVIRAREAAFAHPAFREVRASRTESEIPMTEEQVAMRADALGRVGDLVAEASDWHRRAEPYRRALSRWLRDGAMAPLASALGGGTVAALLACSAEGT